MTVDAKKATRLVKEGYKVYRQVNLGKKREIPYTLALTDSLSDNSRYTYTCEMEKR